MLALAYDGNKSSHINQTHASVNYFLQLEKERT